MIRYDRVLVEHLQLLQTFCWAPMHLVWKRKGWWRMGARFGFEQPNSIRSQDLESERLSQTKQVSIDSLEVAEMCYSSDEMDR
jgi:hypothetical protein